MSLALQPLFLLQAMKDLPGQKALYLDPTLTCVPCMVPYISKLKLPRPDEYKRGLCNSKAHMRIRQSENQNADRTCSKPREKHENCRLRLQSPQLP